MIGDSQKANATEGSTVNQAKGDMTVGFSAADVNSVLEAFSNKLKEHELISEARHYERLTDFAEKLVDRFTSGTARTEAFNDPDFRKVVSDGQETYVRNDDPEVGSVLIDLIQERSICTSRTLLSLSLNEAVVRAGNLTKNEFAELTICFLYRYVGRRITSFADLIEDIKVKFDAFIDDVSFEDASYAYLQAQSCANVDFAKLDFYASLKHRYSGLLTKGLDREYIESSMGFRTVNSFGDLFIPCVNDIKKYQFNAITKQEIFQHPNALELNRIGIDRLWEAQESNHYTKEEFISKTAKAYPRITEVFRAVDDSEIKGLNLTTVGIAIAHANAKRVTGFDADLSIWIK